MRSVAYFIIICLSNCILQMLAFGQVHPIDFEIKYHPIKCFNETKEREPTLHSEIHVDCSSQHNYGPCSSNVSRTDIFIWLSKFYQDVKSLYLEYNCISEVLALPFFPNLTILKYKYNKIEYIEDGAFNSLPSLENLDLSHNQITELNPGIFNRNLSTRPLSIKSLHLGYNRIKSINYLTFEQLSSLQELHLDGNPLGEIDPSTAMALKFISGKSLQVLNLGKTGISSFPVYFLEGSKIRALYLNGNNFFQVPPELIHLKDSLEFLNINENPITVLKSDSFFALNQLREIVASGMNNLTDVNGGTFIHLKSLEKLTLSFNRKLSFIDPNAFCIDSCRSSQYAIKIVYLNHNNLHYISEDLLPWNQLDELSLSSNPWVCDWKNEWMTEFNKQFSNGFHDNCWSLPKKPYDDCEGKSGCNHYSLEYGRKIHNFITFFYAVLGVFFIVGILFFIVSTAVKLTRKNCLRLNRLFVNDSEIKVFTSSLHYRKLVNKPSYAI